MQISDDGLRLIAQYEGLRLRAYADPGSGSEPWTIGYGTTRYPDGSPVRPVDACTPAQAWQWLEHDAAFTARVVDAGLQVPVNQPMFDALVSLAYNIGVGAFRRSTLLQLLNEGNYLGAADEFDRWNRAGGRVMNGLVRRRDDEQALFNEGIRVALASQVDAGAA